MTIINLFFYFIAMLFAGTLSLILIGLFKGDL